MGISEYIGDISELSGELLVSWFIANPNGPTAFALGFVELDHSRRLFYRWMHFTGGKTWISHDLASYFTASNEDFGEILFNELLSINNDALVTGKDVKLLLAIPSFVILNDNPQVGAAIAAFVQASLAYDKDWAGNSIIWTNMEANFSLAMRRNIVTSMSA
jgi:hypothetical protein